MHTFTGEHIHTHTEKYKLKQCPQAHFKAKELLEGWSHNFEWPLLKPACWLTYPNIPKADLKPTNLICPRECVEYAVSG